MYRTRKRTRGVVSSESNVFVRDFCPEQGKLRVDCRAALVVMVTGDAGDQLTDNLPWLLWLPLKSSQGIDIGRWLKDFSC